MIDPDVFNDVPIFALLDQEEREVLAQQVSTRTITPGEYLYKSGDTGQHAYLVQYGRVKVTMKDIAGDVVEVDSVEAGGLLGMSSLLAGTEHMTTAVAEKDTCLIEIDRADLATLLQRKPLAGLDMMTMIEKQLRAAHELVRLRATRNPNVEIEAAETLGDRLADGVAKFGGSWTFVIAFGVVLVTYTAINSILGRPWDPYPFILLNLFLSMLAAIQAPVIMMSQNRQDAKDRVRSELDYRVNLKAELEVGELLLRVAKIEQQMADRR
jgi:uncharacterized membrane protein